MNTPDRSIPGHDALSIAELEARFEMQVLPFPISPVEDWQCTCTFGK